MGLTSVSVSLSDSNTGRVKVLPKYSNNVIISYKTEEDFVQPMLVHSVESCPYLNETCLSPRHLHPPSCIMLHLRKNIATKLLNISLIV